MLRRTVPRPPPRGRCGRKDRRGGAGRRPRHPEARSPVAATNCPRSWARRPRRKRLAETFDGDTEVATFPGDLPWTPKAVSGRCFPRPLRRPPRRAISASCASVRRANARAARAGFASHPPRPCLAVPDRRQARNEREIAQRRPATFRLDDPGVVVIEADETSRLGRATIQITPEPDRACAGADRNGAHRRDADFAGARCSGPASPG